MGKRDTSLFCTSFQIKFLEISYCQFILLCPPASTPHNGFQKNSDAKFKNEGIPYFGGKLVIVTSRFQARCTPHFKIKVFKNKIHLFIYSYQATHPQESQGRKGNILELPRAKSIFFIDSNFPT